MFLNITGVISRTIEPILGLFVLILCILRAESKYGNGRHFEFRKNLKKFENFDLSAALDTRLERANVFQK